MNIYNILESDDSDYNINICNGFLSIKDDRANILILALLFYSERRSQYNRNITCSWWQCLKINDGSKKQCGKSTQCSQESIKMTWDDFKWLDGINWPYLKQKIEYE
jgi:hypothetical protein